MTKTTKSLDERYAGRERGTVGLEPCPSETYIDLTPAEMEKVEFTYKVMLEGGADRKLLADKKEEGEFEHKNYDPETRHKETQTIEDRIKDGIALAKGKPTNAWGHKWRASPTKQIEAAHARRRLLISARIETFKDCKEIRGRLDEAEESGNEEEVAKIGTELEVRLRKNDKEAELGFSGEPDLMNDPVLETAVNEFNKDPDAFQQNDRPDVSDIVPSDAAADQKGTDAS